MDIAAALINDAIRKMVYELDVFPDMTHIGDTGMIPPLLLRLLSGIVQTRSHILLGLTDRQLQTTL